MVMATDPLKRADAGTQAFDALAQDGDVGLCRQSVSAVADDVGDGLGVGPFHACRLELAGGGQGVECSAHPVTSIIS